jgi:5'-methylthioadenosine phosphorylase
MTKIVGRPSIGVIGGSGLYAMAGLGRLKEVRVSTPFGSPSDAIMLGDVEGIRVAFLARHGRGHRLSPSEINYRANIYALKKLGVERVVSVSAVGSMKEALEPSHVAIPHQLIDLTKRRIGTFFDRGIVAHVALADPICRDMADKLAEAVRKAGGTAHEGGVYLCIEGPQFSTRAEALLYRSWGVDVIGMTNLPEAKLAREAQLCYATLALVTDYDCWHSEHEAVTVDAVIATLQRNVALSQQVLRQVIPPLQEERLCSCGSSLASAVITSVISSTARKRLALLLPAEKTRMPQGLLKKRAKKAGKR